MTALSKNDLQELERQLQEQSKSLAAFESRLEKEALRETNSESTGELSRIPLHPADQGTTEFDQRVSISVAQTEIHRLQLIEGALKRIHKGTYGICMNCEESIALARLQSTPETPYCLTCQKEMEAQAKINRQLRADPDDPDFLL